MAPTVTATAGSADQRLCQTWSQNLKSAQTARMAFERQWQQNLAFYHGRQWIVVGRAPDGNGFVLSEAPTTDKYRVRFTANRIKRIIRQELTKLSKEEPQFYTKPASTDESDRAAAMAADAIAEYLLINKHFNTKRTEATFWATICGTAFIKNGYNAQALELDGRPGKIDFEAVSAWHLFVPYLQIVDIQKQPWVIHGRVMSPEEVWNDYQVDVSGDTDVANTILDSRFMSAMGINNTRDKAGKMCYVKECWVKPSKNFPKGAMFVLTNDKVLYVYEPPVDPTLGELDQLELPFDGSVDSMGNADGFGKSENEGPPKQETQFTAPKSDLPGLKSYEYEFPYSHGNFPFCKIDHIPTGMFYADSAIKDLIPIQKEYNRTRSVMLETRNIAAKPQYSFTKGAFNPKDYSAKPGLMLAVNLGFDPPKPLQQPELPPSITAELQTAISDFDFAGGNNEIAQGKTPPGVEAASAIAYLQEENDTILFHTVQSLEQAVQDTGQQVLSLVHDYWDEDRIVTVTSRNQAYEVKKFKASSLRPMSDFRVESGSMAPRSTAAKQAFITEIMKMGWVDPKKAFKFLQMSETNAMYDDMMLDDRHAQRENMRMADGEVVNIRPSDEMPEQTDPMSPIPVEPLPKMAVELDEYGQPVVDPVSGQPKQYVVTINSWDNHEVHLEVHQSYMKTQEFELLDEKTKQIFEDHVDEHKKEIIKEMRYAQMGITSQQPVGGSPPGGPENEPIQDAEVIQ